MYVLLTLLLLLLAAVTLVALRLSRPSASYAWLAATLGVLLAWISIFFWQIDLPQRLFPADGNHFLPGRTYPIPRPQEPDNKADPVNNMHQWDQQQ